MTFAPGELAELKQQAAALPPLLRIGKSGITPGVVQEVACQLAQRGMVKLKLLKTITNAQDRHALAMELAAKTTSMLVHVVGSIVILAKKPGRELSVRAKHRGSR